jgi:undecaprenyl-diphosphatase
MSFELNLTDIAEFVAMHAVTALSIAMAITLIVTALLWRLIERVGPGWLGRVAAWWSAGSQHALVQRLRTVPVVGSTLQTTVHHTVNVGRYLGAHAILSFIAAMMAMMGFVAIVDEIGFDESLAQFDLALANALSRHLPQTVLKTCAVITHLGDRAALIAVTCGVAIVLFWRRKFLLAMAWLVTTASGGIMNSLLKLWFARVRPVHDHGFAVVDGWSFPSGHASGSMLVYGLLGYVIVRHTRAAFHIPIAVITVMVVIGVGASRVLLQVHFFSDVLAGWATATMWISLCIAGLEAVRLRRGWGSNGVVAASEPRDGA